MNWEWISQKGSGLVAIVIGAGCVVIACFNAQYRYLFACAAVAAFWYAFRQLRKRDTPFEKRERELRRKTL
jgi:hypothetical protein